MPDREPTPSSRRWRVGAVVLFVALVIVPLITVAIASTFLFRPGGRTLEVDMRATGGSYAQIFWSSDYAMSAERSALASLHQRPDGFETLRFALPQEPLETVRFDPLDGPGEVVIRQMRVVDADGRTVRTIDPVVLVPLYQIASIGPDKDGLRIVIAPPGNDPMLVARSSWFAAPPRWFSLQFVTPLSLAWIAGAVLVVIATAIGFLGRELVAGPWTKRDVLWLLALFLVILAAKLVLMRSYPVLVPFWDQWDGEALTLYIPWAHDGVTWRQMFTFHNEHRIFFSRLLAMVLVIVNGQWDPQLQVVVNALLHSATAVLAASMLWLAAGRRFLPAIALAIGLGFAPPFAAENTIGGFQSPFYFLLLFSILALWLMGMHRAGSAPWWLGVFCAACTPFTVAGGILVLAGIGSLVLLRAVAMRSGWRQLAINSAALLAVAAVGYGALPPSIQSHQALKAQSTFFFAVALARNAAFPFINLPHAAVLMWLPLGVLVVVLVRRRLRSTAIEQFTIALGVWVLVQCLAMAYSRGGTGVPPASRYQDMLAFGPIANVMVFLSALAVAATRRHRALVGGTLLVWLGVTSVGLMSVSRHELEMSARDRRQWTEAQVKSVRHFVVTGDLERFLQKRGPQELPYHNPMLLAGWLSDPFIRRILPAAVRQPLDIRARAGSANPASAPPARPADEVAPLFDSYAIGRLKAVGHFESDPVACHQFGHLRFEVFSSTSWSGLRLAIHDIDAGRDVELGLRLDRTGGWNSVVVRCPNGPFTVKASDDSPTAWLAVGPPAEIAWASTVALWMVQQSRIIALAALALAGLAVVVSVRDLHTLLDAARRSATPGDRAHAS